MRFSWLEMVDLLRAAAKHRGGRAELHGSTLFLTPARGTVITVTDGGDEGALIQAGWAIKLLADCDADRFVPPQALYVVEAIMDGYAEEATLATADGESWAGVAFRIRTPYGDIVTPTTSPGSAPGCCSRGARHDDQLCLKLFVSLDFCSLMD